MANGRFFVPTCRAANLWTSGNSVADKTANSHRCSYVHSDHLLEVWNNAQCRKQLDSERESSHPLADLRYHLLESWVRVIKPMSKQHAHHDVCHTRRGQLINVKRTTLLLPQFVYHLFDLNQDPRLHHALTKSKPFQDGQAQPVIALERGIVMARSNSCKKTQMFQRYDTIR